MPMNNERIISFKDVLIEIENASTMDWIYLPKTKNWSLDSNCAILRSEEVSPEQEDDPEAGIQEFVKNNNLLQVLPVQTLLEIIANARAQKPSATLEELFKAFNFYHTHDAFIQLK